MTNELRTRTRSAIEYRLRMVVALPSAQPNASSRIGQCALSRTQTNGSLARGRIDSRLEPPRRGTNVSVCRSRGYPSFDFKNHLGISSVLRHSRFERNQDVPAERAFTRKGARGRASCWNPSAFTRCGRYCSCAGKVRHRRSAPTWGVSLVIDCKALGWEFRRPEGWLPRRSWWHWVQVALYFLYIYTFYLMYIY